MRHLKTVPRNIGSSQCFHIGGAVCWSWSWAFFSSLNPSAELQTSISLYRHWQSCYHAMLLFWPWPHQLRQMVISVPTWHVSTQRKWWICFAENMSSFLGHSPWPSTWAVQCNGKRKWRCSRTCQPAPPQKATRVNSQTTGCFFWGSWKSIWRRWRMPLHPGLQSHCRRGSHDCS